MQYKPVKHLKNSVWQNSVENIITFLLSHTRDVVDQIPRETGHEVKFVHWKFIAECSLDHHHLPGKKKKYV